MDDVTFNEPTYAARHDAPAQKRSFLTRTVIGLGLAKDETGAQRVLLIIAILAIVAAVIIFFTGRSHVPAGGTPPILP